MFGKKDKPKEPPEETTKKEERKHRLWPDGDITRALAIIEDTVATGQIKLDSPRTPTASLALAFTYVPAHVTNPLERYFYTGIEFDKIVIKSQEKLEAEQRAIKEKELAKAIECLDKDLAAIEKLSKELGK
jgi:hypothetical protein